MERIELWSEAVRVAEGVLGEAGVVVRDPRGAPGENDRAAGPGVPGWFLRPESGTVVAYDLQATRLVPRPVPPERPVGVQGGLTLVRRSAAAGDEARREDDEPPTARLPRGLLPSTPLRLVVGDPGRGRGRLVDRPLRLGRDPRCELRLLDPHASRIHLLVEPAGAAVRVRDLGSENGTFCDGRRVHLGELHAGQALRVGRTTVHVVGGDVDDSLVGEAPAFLAARHAVDRLADTDWPVLLLGETGVGKEALARRVHQRSVRRAGPFVAWNAATLGPELADSQLFGHVRGAFTGATGDHGGAFEAAHQGTLFLDELGELPLAVQARLLRVLEDGVVRPVGSARERSVDVRIVAATHHDLRARVASGAFRADLYHRLAVAPVRVPPVRARRDDLPALCAALLARQRATLGARVLAPEALAWLAAHPLPGNVRELRNLLLRAALLGPGPVLGPDDLRLALAADEGGSAHDPLEPAVARAAVDSAGGNVTLAARQLGVPRSTLRDRLRGGAGLT